jgi:MscS family membrane protein
VNSYHFCLQILDGCYGITVEILSIIAAVFFLYIFLKYLIFSFLKSKISSKNYWALSFLAALEKPLILYILIFAAVYIVDSLSFMIYIRHFFTKELVLSVAGVFAFGWFLLRWNKELMSHLMLLSSQKEIPITPGKLDLLSKLFTMMAVFIVIFLLMDVTDRNLQTLIAFGGIGGLALAFASQQVIANFFGGVMVYITQPFTVGEWIQLPEKSIEGHIEEIGWYLTCIRNFDKRPIYVPNSIFTQTIVVTPSRMSHERFRYVISLRHCDLNAVHSIINELKQHLLKHPLIDQKSKVDAYLINLGRNSLDIEISAYLLKSSATYFPAIRQEFLLKIAEIIEKNEAKIATPLLELESLRTK